jgi:hypothetical protein
MLIPVCLLDSNLNAHAKPENTQAIMRYNWLFSPSPEAYALCANSTKQDKMHNVTLRHVRETLLLWKSNKYYIFLCACIDGCAQVCGNEHVCVCACGFTHPACNAHASYYIIMCGLSGFTMFFDIIS